MRSPVHRWISIAGAPNGRMRPHMEPLSSAVAWEQLLTIARSRRAGLQHFRLIGSQARPTWEEFANYVRQAREYFSGAQTINGTSAALLYYYCLLQLAKAELLASHSDRILGKAIGHGLKHEISRAGHPRKDYLTVSAGVFPLLYEKRTGRTIPAGTVLKIADLLAFVPEIGSELASSTGVQLSVVPFFYSAFEGAQNLQWTALLAPSGSFLENPREPFTKRLFSETFESAPLHYDWKKLFGLSARSLFAPAMFQSRSTFSTIEFDMRNVFIPLESFRGHLGNPINWLGDGLLCPTLPRTDLPMNPSIARYALFYYLSSLVRYKPSVLDQRKYPDFSWVFDSFCRMTPLHSVVDATDGVTEAWNFYGNTMRS